MLKDGHCVDLCLFPSKYDPITKSCSIVQKSTKNIRTTIVTSPGCGVNEIISGIECVCRDGYFRIG